jgi:hypothetical protein
VVMEQSTGERSPAINADHARALALAQRGERSREIDALVSGHELPHGPAPGVPRRRIGMEREDVGPVAAFPERLPVTHAPAPVDHGEQRTVGGRAGPRGSGQGLPLGEDGVGAGEGHVLRPVSGQRVEAFDVWLELGGRAVERHRHMDDDIRTLRPGSCLPP